LVDFEVRLGYSCWGFLGPGVTDTPDGGRSHRRPLIDALERSGQHVTLLQRNRDLAEAGDRVANRYRFDAGFPMLNALMLEWRWPIPGRNDTACMEPGHTCDLHRQRELLAHYTDAGLPTVIWDKDRQLPAGDPLRASARVAVFEAALELSPGAHRLLFPVDDALVDGADPQRLARRPRPTTLAYVGNQYDRDEAFDAFFAPAAGVAEHEVAGKWTRTERWPGLNFTGRTAFTRVREIYSRSLATVLLLPDHYARAGQVTQRIFEAVLAGCVPLAPASLHRADEFVPDLLIVRDAADVVDRLAWLRSIAGSDQHAALIADCLLHLDIFRLSAQVAHLDAVLRELTEQACTGATRP
jgi:hypothetical protein